MGCRFQTLYQEDPLLPVLYEDTSLGDVQLSTILAKSAARNRELKPRLLNGLIVLILSNTSFGLLYQQ
jgi:hypothetical protein